MRYTTLASPIGPLILASDGRSLTGLRMPPERPDPTWTRDDAAEPFRRAKSQLNAYFRGKRTAFDLPLRLEGTPFQSRVWAALCGIPYGETRSYADIARRIGNPKACRAVGLANGRNPIGIIVPCHRVIGADGSLTGFGGGLTRKRALLTLERCRAGR